MRREDQGHSNFKNPLKEVQVTSNIRATAPFAGRKRRMGVMRFLAAIKAHGKITARPSAATAHFPSEVLSPADAG